nr:unnamed protein product [Digitaria exilis]
MQGSAMAEEQGRGGLPNLPSISVPHARPPPSPAPSFVLQRAFAVLATAAAGHGEQKLLAHPLPRILPQMRFSTAKPPLPRDGALLEPTKDGRQRLSVAAAPSSRPSRRESTSGNHRGRPSWAEFGPIHFLIHGLGEWQPLDASGRVGFIDCRVPSATAMGSHISPMRGSMSNYHDNHAEELEDDYDYDMDDPVDDMVDEHQDRGFMDSDSDDENYVRSNADIPDTSSEDARKGKDMQGILWERLAVTREKYRQTRLEQYKNYENVPNSGEEAIKDCKTTEKGGMYYEFRQNTRSVKSTILHFQVSKLPFLSFLLRYAMG